MDVVAEAADGSAALDVLGSGTQVDVVLMDLRMGEGVDGVDATCRIVGLPSPPPVLVLTTYGTDADILSAVETGETGYMLKDARPSSCALLRVRPHRAGPHSPPTWPTGSWTGCAHLGRC